MQPRDLPVVPFLQSCRRSYSQPIVLLQVTRSTQSASSQYSAHGRSITKHPLLNNSTRRRIILKRYQRVKPASQVTGQTLERLRNSVATAWTTSISEVTIGHQRFHLSRRISASVEKEGSKSLTTLYFRAFATFKHIKAFITRYRHHGCPRCDPQQARSLPSGTKIYETREANNIHLHRPICRWRVCPQRITDELEIE